MNDMFENLYDSNVTVISNEFLNEYLSDTKPEYIKVFLFYYWKGFKEKYTIEDAANELDLPVDCVERALKYWVKKGIFKKACIEINESNNLVDFDTKKKELINKNRKEYSEIEKSLLFVAEKMLGKTLSDRQIDLISKCYNEYGFDEAVIHYLFEYCYSVSSTDARYMKAVASSWYEQNVKSVQDAKKITESFEKRANSKSNVKNKNVNANNNIANNNIDRDKYNEWFKNNVLAKQKG